MTKVHSDVIMHGCLTHQDTGTSELYPKQRKCMVLVLVKVLSLSLSLHGNSRLPFPDKFHSTLESD